ncbi:YheC/YheD family protein [Paenibacillus sp. NPDC056579]|uniref:YheC/YheD family endospore coat-associated protein n=1 Tax=Paenibacillus sp. NPDC056579 TaxID=3345871 RepID=UPI0036A68525
MQHSYVGILVNDKLYNSIPVGDTKYEAIDFYVEAGRRYGVTPCFFRIHDVRSANPWIKAYVKQDDRFVLTRVPLPVVIHNRALYHGRKKFRELGSWADGGTLFFNQWNRYSKLQTQHILLNETSLKPHLPETFTATSRHIDMMMKQYDKLIIKPDQSGVGRGIMLLERNGDNWKLTFPASLSVHNRRWKQMEFKGNRIPSLLTRWLRKKKFIVQQRLPLATFQGRPFDMRVSVQRDGSGEWQVTGLVAKVAPHNRFLTNVAQGGSLQQLQDILAQEYPQLQQQDVFQAIHEFSLKIARILGSSLPHMADLGLDIGITKDGVPLFIECNGKDQRYAFREAGMTEEWKASYYNPIAYSKYLLDQRKQ